MAVKYDKILDKLREQDSTISIGGVKLGVWDAAENYAVDDIVTFDGEIYRSIQAGSNKQPDNNPDYWTLYNEQLPMTTVTDPALNAAVTTAIVDGFSGNIVTLTTTGNAQTIQDPTDTTAGKRFTVVNNDTSSDTLTVNSNVLDPGEAISFIWDGSAWVHVKISENLWELAGSDIRPITAGQNLELRTGGLKDANATTAISLADGANTSFDTTSKTITGAVNELKTDLDGFPDGLKSLTADEITQLQNIDSTTISTTQWGYLGAMDQGVATTSTVTFNDITVTTPSNIYALSHDSFADFLASEHYLQTAITNVSTALSTGLLKVTTGTGALSIATAGTDYFNASSQVDHDQTTNFAANEHFLQTAITNVSTGLSTGLLTVTNGTGALGSTTNNTSNWDTAYTERGSQIGGANLTWNSTVLDVDDSFILNTGDTGTGVYDFGGATSFEMPNAASPLVDTTGEIAIQTTATGLTNGALTYFGGSAKEYVVALDALPSDDGYVVSYNATSDKFEMAEGGGGLPDGTTNGQLLEWDSGAWGPAATTTAIFDSGQGISVSARLSHIGDTDTYVAFSVDEITLTAGGLNFLLCDETSTDIFHINPNQANIDFRYDGDTSAAVLYANAGTENVTINGTKGLSDANFDLCLDGDGVLCMQETTTPTATANYGKVYCKTDDKLYFQDGAGAEHEIAFV